MRIKIFDYTNYRLYLRDCYEELKQNSSSFSYRYFSKKCGYSSPNFLKLVIEDKRNLSNESIEKFSNFFKLENEEKLYFKSLVGFNQAKNTKEKQKFAEEILRNSLFTRLNPLAKDQFEYISKWYYVAIREILKTKKIKLNAKEISKIIRPKLAEATIEEALATLLRLNIIKKKDNRLVPVEGLVTTGDEVTFSGVAGYHRQMMSLASDSIDLFDRSFRDISGVTISLSDEGFNELKVMVQKFRKNVLELSERDKVKENVYQLNVQLFPLTEVEK